MDRSITLKIIGKEYHLKADSPEKERLMRLAAEDVNRMYVQYEDRFPERSIEDKLAFVTLMEAIAKISAQERWVSLRDEAAALNSGIDTYLADKENK